VLDGRLVDEWVPRLRREVPDAVAIFLAGSQLRGDAGPYSDIDFDILVAHGPRDEWPGFVAVHGDRPVRISTWIRDVDAWLAASQEPQDWAFGLSCADPLRLCWADGPWRDRLDRAELTYPAGPPEVDHFEGDAGKVANAWTAGDEPVLRLAAGDLARSVVSLLAPLNPRPPVRSRPEALRSLLGFDPAPAGYRPDVLTCLGLRGEPTAVGVAAAARRLATGTVQVLRTHEETLAPLVPEHSARSLHDGSLYRLVEHAAARLPGS
jgi:phosphoribosyl-AMP cyclohydrolase